MNDTNTASVKIQNMHHSIEILSKDVASLKTKFKEMVRKLFVNFLF